MRLRTAFAALSMAALASACAEEADAPHESAAAPAAPATGPGGLAPGVAPCRGSQLQLSNEGGDAGAGNRVVNIGLQNISAAACSLTGYPGVVLQNEAGRNLAIRSEQSLGSYFAPGEAPALVTLAPQARAAFELAWSVVPNEAIGEKVCPAASRLRVTAPGDASPVSLDMSLTPCGGRVRVSPVRPLAEPLRAAAPAAQGASNRAENGVAERA